MFLPYLYLFYFTGLIATGIGSFSFWAYRKVNGSSIIAIAISLLLGSLFVEGICNFVASQIGFEVKPVYKTGQISLIIAGLLIKTCAKCGLAFVIFSRRLVEEKK